MRRVTVAGIEATDVERAVGPNTYLKGARYARDQAVLHMEWDDEEHTLGGAVRGSAGRLYHASVYFDASPAAA